jgi:raffinose/stachyose/melibiose transport system permease protein
MSALVPAALPVRRRSSGVLVTALLAVAALLWFSPLLILLLTGLRTASDFLANGPLSWPTELTLANFPGAWETGNLGTTFRNSILITVIKVPLGVLLSAMLAYALAKLRIPYRGAILFTVVLGLTIPIYIAVTPLFGMLRSVGLTDSLAGLVGPYLAFGIPFEVLVLHAFFRQLPDEIIEAARVDGASNAHIFFRIVLPLSLPALVTVGILDAVATWNEFLMALILLSSPDSRTLTLGLLGFQGQFAIDYTGLAAGILLVVAPVLIAYAFLQRYIVSGLTAGSIKG